MIEADARGTRLGFMPRYTSGCLVAHDELVATLGHAEDAGYESIWVSDHVVMPTANTTKYPRLVERLDRDGHGHPGPVRLAVVRRAADPAPAGNRDPDPASAHAVVAASRRRVSTNVGRAPGPRCRRRVAAGGNKSTWHSVRRSRAADRRTDRCDADAVVRTRGHVRRRSHSFRRVRCYPEARSIERGSHRRRWRHGTSSPTSLPDASVTASIRSAPMSEAWKSYSRRCGVLAHEAGPRPRRHRDHASCSPRSQDLGTSSRRWASIGSW